MPLRVFFLNSFLSFSSVRISIHWSINSLQLRCHQLKDVDGSAQVAISAMTCGINAAHAQAEFAIDASLTISISFVNRDCVSFAEVMLGGGQAFANIHDTSSSERRPVTRQGLLHHSVHAIVG